MCKPVKNLAPNFGDKKVNKRIVMSCHVVHFQDVTVRNEDNGKKKKSRNSQEDNEEDHQGS